MNYDKILSSAVIAVFDRLCITMRIAFGSGTNASYDNCDKQMESIRNNEELTDYWDKLYT